MASGVSSIHFLTADYRMTQILTQRRPSSVALLRRVDSDDGALASDGAEAFSEVFTSSGHQRRTGAYSSVWRTENTVVPGEEFLGGVAVASLEEFWVLAINNGQLNDLPLQQICQQQPIIRDARHGA